MASKSLNRVELIGNVTRDPELRYTPQGNAVCTMGLATNRSWKTENGEVREEAEFHRLVAWNKLAELCSQLCTKGRKLWIEGRLQTRTFTGSDNAQHTITEIVINDMILLDSRMQQGAGGTGGYQQRQSQPVADSTAVVADDTNSAAMPAADDSNTEESSEEPKGKKKKADKEETTSQEEVSSQPAVDIDEIPF